MTTLKRIGTIETGCAGLTVKLIVTKTGYQIKTTKVFGKNLPITLLNREIVGSSKTVDELFDRYSSRISVNDLTDYHNDDSNPIYDIVINGTSGDHKITIEFGDDESLLFKSTAFDEYVIVKSESDSSYVETQVLENGKLKFKTTSGVRYRYENEELVSASKEI